MIWIFKMAAPDSKMADMQNKVVVFIVQRYIFYNREAKYIFKRCTLKNMTWYGLSKWLPPIQRWPTLNTNVVVFVTERCIFLIGKPYAYWKRILWRRGDMTFQNGAANSKMADKICVNCYRFSFRIMHFFNRETIYILKTQNGSTWWAGKFSKWLPPIPRWPSWKAHNCYSLWIKHCW